MHALVASGESLQVFVLDFSGEIGIGVPEEYAEVIDTIIESS